MPKYLCHASYTADGVKGLIKDTAAGRKAAISAAVKGLKGKLECLYFAFGEDDVVLIVDLPDNASAAAIALATRATGLVSTRITPLLSVAEVDQAISINSKYRAPGQEK